MLQGLQRKSINQGMKERAAATLGQRAQVPPALALAHTCSATCASSLFAGFNEGESPSAALLADKRRVGVTRRAGNGFE